MLKQVVGGFHRQTQCLVLHFAYYHNKVNVDALSLRGDDVAAAIRPLCSSSLRKQKQARILS